MEQDRVPLVGGRRLPGRAARLTYRAALQRRRASREAAGLRHGPRSGRPRPGRSAGCGDRRRGHRTGARGDRHRRARLPVHPAARVGQRWSGLCPFHAEKSPRFSVNATEGLYHCFGCKASGDAITFLREIEQLDFVGAVESLAARASIALRYTDHDGGEDRKRRTRLFELMERAVDWYHERLRTVARRRSGPRVPALPGFDARGGGRPSGSAGHPTLGRADPRAARCPRPTWRRRGLGFQNRARPPAGLLPGAGAVPDLRRTGPADRLRWAQAARRRRSEVPELAGTTSLYHKSKVALRAELGEGRRRQRTTRSSCARATPT